MVRNLITSALLCVNGVPHLGHLVGCLLPADVYARWLRAKGEEVLFLMGTDEHGTTSEVGAAKENMPVDAYCKKYHDLHVKMYDDFNLSYDFCGRTSSDESKEAVYHIFEALDKNGYIFEKETNQVFSIDDNRYLPDSYVMGTCPYCGYEKAKGDQCESCTKVLDPTDLKDIKSVLSGSSNVEIRKTKHLFIDLPKAQPFLYNWIESKKGIWPDLTYSIAKKWLNEGLQPRGITRDLKWGFPVPRPGFENKVFYVWFDAPIGYIGITKEWAKQDAENRDYKDWWLNASDVKHTEFMGKDNIPFHTVIFPTELHGTQENWTQVSMLKGFSYLNFSGGKFSKSAQRGIFLPDAAIEMPIDYWRYWLIANAPETDDTNFTFEGFATVINKDLNDVLGNFINRVIKMTLANFETTITEKGAINNDENELYAHLDTLIANFKKHMDAIEYRKAMAILREIWVSGNNYIAKTEPWKVVKVDKQRAATILYTAFNLIRLYGHLSAMIMPQAAQKMLNIVGDASQFTIPTTNMHDYLQELTSGNAFYPTEPLFSKILPERVQELQVKYKEV